MRKAAHRAAELARVVVDRRRAELEPTTLEERDDATEVIELLAREVGERTDEARGCPDAAGRARARCSRPSSRSARDRRGSRRGRSPLPSPRTDRSVRAGRTSRDEIARLGGWGPGSPQWGPSRVIPGEWGKRGESWKPQRRGGARSESCSLRRSSRPVAYRCSETCPKRAGFLREFLSPIPTCNASRPVTVVPTGALCMLQDDASTVRTNLAGRE